MIAAVRRTRWRRWWSVAGALVGALALALVLWRIDYRQMGQVIADANLPLLSLLPLSIAAEQLVRAWKWRQLMFAIRPIRTMRLFGAIMAGYFSNVVIPLGMSPIVRSWLVARLEALKVSAVLATAAIDRLVDGVVFTAFVAVALSLAVFDDPGGGIRRGLTIGGLGSLVLFAFLLCALARYKQRKDYPDRTLTRLIRRLPLRLSRPVGDFAASFADGIVWPREPWRGVGVVQASIVIKIVAITHFLWAGLAFGVVLSISDYVFLTVFLGFLIILTRVARIPGGFFFGALFAFDRLGVAEESALAMTIAVQIASLLTVSVLGAFALWRHGAMLDALRLSEGRSDGWQ